MGGAMSMDPMVGIMLIPPGIPGMKCCGIAPQAPAAEAGIQVAIVVGAVDVKGRQEVFCFLGAEQALGEEGAMEGEGAL